MELQKPHDHFFRSFYAHPGRLAALLELTLPSEVYNLLDVTTLSLKDGTWIDEGHSEHSADLAATVQIKGQLVHLYVLVEHKSYSDRWALLQILRYMVQTWSLDSKDQPSAPLQPIIPILFYHGEAKKVSDRFSQLFHEAIPSELRPYRPEFLCDVYNLTMQPDSSFRGPPEQQAALWAMKYARTQVDLALRAWDRLAKTAGRVLLENPAFKEIELYLMSASSMTAEELLDTINRHLKETYLKEELMSTAELLIAKGEMKGRQEGKLEGIQEGIQEGRQEGRQEEKLETARRLKELGISADLISKATGLSEAEIEKL
ncbi:MAG: Rpn family recombination-promoting nuclease/putative transposase [Spirochaetales bacterium]|nr:Rpn family recombination-promoting nuclease/putative transposase [Spirochaetales bacterium]